MPEVCKSNIALKNIIIASHNAGKVREIDDLLKPLGFNTTSAGEMGLPSPEETGDTFIKNAIIKAKSAIMPNYWALADDSGLCVDDLGGQPGIYSARWAGDDKTFKTAMERIEQELKKCQVSPPFNAHFVCALALWDGKDIHTFEGKVYGQLTFPPRGDQGFGYDPIFIPNGHTQTFGEMTYADKERISHRRNAFDKLVRFLDPC